MRSVRMGRSAVNVVAFAATIAALGVGSIYGLSEWKMRRPYDEPLVALRTAAPVEVDRSRTRWGDLP